MDGSRGRRSIARSRVEGAWRPSARLPRLAALALLVGSSACGADGGSPVDVEPTDTLPGGPPVLSGTWSAAPSLPRGLERPELALHRGALYLLGGATAGYGTDIGTTDELHVLDLGGDGTWSPGPVYPVDGYDIALVSVGDTLLGVGGVAWPSKRWDRLFALPPAGEAWERRPFGEEPRGRLSAARIGERLYLLEQDNSGRLWIHDRTADTWTEAAPLPVGRGDSELVAVDGIVYSVLGDDLDNVGVDPAFIYAYDPATGAWTRLTQAPSSRHRPAVAVLGDRIHVFGGLAPDRSSSATHQVYDLGEDRWYEAPPLPEGRAGPVAVAVDGTIWVAGGAGGEASRPLRTEVWIYTPDDGGG